MDLTLEIVKRLIEEQYPAGKDLSLYPVEKSGHDNDTFHLGKHLVVRLPSGEAYATQVVKESKWLPYLQQHLDYPITNSIFVGKPTDYFPYPWSINQWIDGETLADCSIIDKVPFARDLAKALKQLQSIPCEDGPAAGIHNFHRGGDLNLYHMETIEALEALRTSLPADRLLALWKQCCSTVQQGSSVWVHGDIAPGNILLKDHQFYGLIDFGILGVGDPACDYAMAWTYFQEESRNVFLDGLSPAMIDRAKGWALWKALITYDADTSEVRDLAKATISAILAEDQDAVIDQMPNGLHQD